ncbi:MAG: alkaline phosphatase D family protein [Sphingobium sp.]
MTTRRQFVAGGMLAGIGLAAPAILRAQSLSDPFALGVTAGDPAPDGFVIWTRIAPSPLERHGGVPMIPMSVQWQVARDERFATIVAGGEAVARPEIGHSVHVEVGGLDPDRPYWYRFLLNGVPSPHGRARTLPALASHRRRLRFGVCGCMNWQDGLFTALDHLAREDLAFVYHFGDFIYETSRTGATKTYWDTPMPLVREHLGGECFDLGDYRLRYAQYLTDPALRAARAAHLWLPSFDDHEVANNWVADIDAKGTPPELFALRRQAALQAWYEFMPVRRSMLPRGGAVTAWRGLRYGDLAAIDVLDTRSYRSDQPCGDNFKPACPAVLDEGARVLSAGQEAWLTANVQRRDVAWHGIAQQVMMMALDRRTTADAPDKIMNLDSWAGYEVPRRRLLSHMKGLGNVVVLTGDEHQNFAGVLDDGAAPVAVEFVSTSIASGGDGSDVRPGSQRMLANNANLHFLNDQRGYLVCDVTPDAWATDFMVVDRVSAPGAAIRKRATATVARGEVNIGMG